MRPTSTLLILIATLHACATQQVSYRRDITPIFDNNCNGCHASPSGYGYKITGLTLDSYDDLMKGTVYGPIVLSGDSRRSILNKLIEGRTGTLQRDTHGDKKGISDKEIQTIKNWVDQGALNN